ncbi:MAG: NAD(P)-dependent oxidoreductase [Bacteroidetes bacterium]|nr:MAG: NAD(P)-dependent oxidoreductase [Bacteroidota bacterium]
MKSKNLLITGASGFIGGRIVERLAALPNTKITATGRTTCHRFDALDNVEYVQVDLLNNVPRGTFTACIHVAGLADDKASYEDLFAANVSTTANVCKNLSSECTFIFISSPSVYSFRKDIPYTEDMASEHETTNHYGLTKLKAETLIRERAFTSAYALRPRAVYGPGDHTLRPRILKRVKGNKMVFPGPLSECTSMTHVDNLCDAVIACLNRAELGFHVYNIADANPYRLEDVFLAIAKAEYPDRDIRIETIPASIVRGIIRFFNMFRIPLELTLQSVDYVTRPAHLDISKAERELGYKAVRDFFRS